MSDLDVAARIPHRGLDVRFHVPAGEVLAVLGPNGSGKSTTAAVIAGLLAGGMAGDEAVVQVGERIVTDTSRGLRVPPHDRRIGLLLQNPLLFPHLTVQGNVEFAARRRGPRTTARARAMHWLGLVGAADLASRRPGQLSGGQAQRVAIARALAAEPELLVLDEPLAGLDVDIAAAVRAVLRRVLTADGRSAVLITHDLLDVLTLADRVLVLEAGRISEIGSTTTLLTSPRSDFGARVAGVNLVRGQVREPGTIGDATGRIWHGVILNGEVADSPVRGEDAVAVFPPSAVAVYRARPDGSPRNTVRVTITGMDAIGRVVRVRANWTVQDAAPDFMPDLMADITGEAVTELRLVVGDSVWFAVKAQEVRIQVARPVRHD